MPRSAVRIRVHRLTGWLATAAALLAAAPIAAQPQPPTALISAAPKPTRTFRPSVHGFRFINAFEGSPLPIALPALERNLSLPNAYGLCGGMSFAAADFFHAGATIPSFATPPARGTPLYNYLYSRQTASLGPGLNLAAKFARWMSLPDDTTSGTARLTLEQWPTIRDRLQRAEPTVLGLVLTSTRARGQLWENHQVLGYDLTTRSNTEFDISIYDPNYPTRDDAIIRARLRPLFPAIEPPDLGRRLHRPTLGMACTRIVPNRSTTPIRGLFLMPYTPATPPADLPK